MVGCGGGAAGGQQAIVEDAPIEWVEISIHMPDGRVIVSKEPRYPSRSRVYLTTGQLPAFKTDAVARSSGVGTSESGGLGGVSVAEVLEDGEELAIDIPTEIGIDEEVLGGAESEGSASPGSGGSGGSKAVTTFKKSS